LRGKLRVIVIESKPLISGVAYCGILLLCNDFSRALVTNRADKFMSSRLIKASPDAA
jgi:hypothetical protein